MFFCLPDEDLRSAPVSTSVSNILIVWLINHKKWHPPWHVLTLWPSKSSSNQKCTCNLGEISLRPFLLPKHTIVRSRTLACVFCKKKKKRKKKVHFFHLVIWWIMSYKMLDNFKYILIERAKSTKYCYKSSLVSMLQEFFIFLFFAETTKLWEEIKLSIFRQPTILRHFFNQLCYLLFLLSQEISKNENLILFKLLSLKPLFRLITKKIIIDIFVKNACIKFWSIEKSLAFSEQFLTFKF